MMLTTPLRRGHSYIARYALGEGGDQPFYRKTTSAGWGVGGSTKLSDIAWKGDIRLEAIKVLKEKIRVRERKRERNHAFSCCFF